MSYRGSQLRERDPRTGRLFRIIGRAQRRAPPAPLRRARLDNLALVPGNALLDIDRWRTVAKRLPRGQLLIILPNADCRQRQTFEKVAAAMRAKGRGVTTMQIEAV